MGLASPVLPWRSAGPTCIVRAAGRERVRGLAEVETGKLERNRVQLRSALETVFIPGRPHDWHESRFARHARSLSDVPRTPLAFWGEGSGPDHRDINGGCHHRRHSGRLALRSNRPAPRLDSLAS